MPHIVLCVAPHRFSIVASTTRPAFTALHRFSQVAVTDSIVRLHMALHRLGKPRQRYTGSSCHPCIAALRAVPAETSSKSGVSFADSKRPNQLRTSFVRVAGTVHAGKLSVPVSSIQRLEGDHVLKIARLASITLSIFFEDMAYPPI